MNEALSARLRAELAQRTASDPRISPWVGASAGSGKTKVLTDRVLRLLLREDAAPGRILCLTYTRAAAAEMATRLARRLGAWAVLPEAGLLAELRRLTGETPTRAEAETARRLFCRVLEQPGGMRISTIHAFCQSLLRSFPLEARLPPGFALLEERDQRAMLAEAREASLAGGRVPAEALDRLAGLQRAEDMATLLDEVARGRGRAEPWLAHPLGPAAALRDHLGLDPVEGPAALDRACVCPEDGFVEVLRGLLGHRYKVLQTAAETLLGLLSEPPDRRAGRRAEWWGALFTRENERRAKLRDVPCLAAEMARQEALEERRATLALWEATAALLEAARPVVADYRARKERRAALDFDDLVHRADALLRDPGSAWVLFKLDGGLDHLLLDEAQDTNPAQWTIADALISEFFSGEGARAAGSRTVFVVGDAKQSIFGFQGADSRGFAEWEGRFERRVEAGGGVFERVPMSVSFRSCAPVLSLVDRVFEDGPARRGVARDGEALRHSADRAGQAGAVEIWPALVRGRPEPAEPWVVPESPVAARDAAGLLAEALAERLRRMVSGETLPSRGGRPIRPGDVMVLVRRRTGFLPRLVRALKARGVPVGGVDRIGLVEQAAVRDLLALLDVLLLPEDDLSLAALLTSPLVGLEEEALLGLCHGREGALWHVLVGHRGGAGPLAEAADWIAALADRADRTTPHALLAEVLVGERRGRARLLARLGPDSAEALDELLSAALRHERSHPPSLQGFLHWLRLGGAEVRREAEGASDAVRILTAHGAKGLQAPVVVLPDLGPGGRRETLLWHRHGEAETPLWAPRKDHQAPLWARARAAREAAAEEEENRLLYVALTRAEDRLLVCGLEDPKRPDAGWHALVRRGFFRGLEAGEAGYGRVPFDPAALGLPAGCGFGPEGWSVTCDQTAEPRPDEAARAEAPPPLPGWASRPAPAEASEDPVAPSRLAGEEAEGPAAAPHGARDPGGRRFRRGLLLHGLLQHLPAHPQDRWEALARAHLARPGHGLPPEEREATLAEVLGVLRHPALAGAFGPGSLAEAPLAGVVGGATVAGQVDRLLVEPHRVLVLDYKTNRPPPGTVGAVPLPYLRQMAAYRAVLRAAWPGRRVEAALVWTWSGQVMPLPDGLLDAHGPGAG